MKILNETEYKTADLARFFRPIVAGELNEEQRKSLYVRVKYGRLSEMARRWNNKASRDGNKLLTPYTSGRAFLHPVWFLLKPGGREVRGRLMTLCLDPQHRADQNALGLAATVVHECGHIRGNHHRDMKGRERYRLASVAERYAEIIAACKFGIKIPRLVTKRIHPRFHPAERKLDHARKMLTARKKKATAAAMLVRKWQQKVRYYERQLETKEKAAALK